jgi:hypothetical protein
MKNEASKRHKVGGRSQQAEARAPFARQFLLPVSSFFILPSGFPIYAYRSG